MKPEQIKNIVEAAIMASDRPLSINQILVLFEQDEDKPDKEVIRTIIEELQQDYSDRGIELKEVASGVRFQVSGRYAEWINRMFSEKPQRYSRALLETLALIAYRQPITRGEIEEIRGVSVNSSIIKTLQEREWIRVVGHRDVPGKPELLATTREFLDYFNLKKLSELPPLSEIKDYDQINPDLFHGINVPVQVDRAPGQAETGHGTESDTVTSTESSMAGPDDEDGDSKDEVLHDADVEAEDEADTNVVSISG